MANETGALQERLDRLKRGFDSGLYVARRELERKVFQFVSGQSHRRLRVLFVRGQGGAGKTWFARALMESFASRADAVGGWSAIELVDGATTVDDLTVLRTRFRQTQAGGRSHGAGTDDDDLAGLPHFVRFDYAITRYWQRTAPHAMFTIPANAKLVETSEGAAAALEIAAEFVEEELPFGAILKIGRGVVGTLSRIRLLKRIPELESLEHLSEREHRRRLTRYFAEDLRRLCRSRSAPVVLVVDNLDVVESTGRAERERREAWVEEIARDPENALLVMLGRALPEWMEKARNDGRLVVETLGELQPLEADELMLAIGMDAHYRAAIRSRSNLPMVVAEKCRWVLEESLRTAAPPSDSIPDTLTEVHDRQLLFRSTGQRRLMSGLALAGTFDRCMAHGLARRLGLGLSECEVDAILRDASVDSRNEEGLLRFHDVLAAHLLDRGDLDEAGVAWREERAWMLYCLYRHVLEDRDGEAVQAHARLFARALRWAPGIFPGLGRAERALLQTQTLHRAMDLMRRLVLANLRSDAAGIGTAVLAPVLDLAAGDDSGADIPIEAMELLHRLCPLLCGREGAANPALALYLVRQARELLSVLAQHGGGGVPASVWNAELASLAVHELRARRALAPGYDGPEQVIRSESRYRMLLDAALNSLVHALSGVPMQAVPALRLRRFLAFCQSEHAHQLGRRGALAEASAHFGSASESFMECRRVSDDHELRKAYAWHLLHPPRGLGLQAEELQNALRELERLRAEQGLDAALAELLVRGLIRVAIKRRDGEMASDRPWHSPLDVAESIVVAAAASDPTELPSLTRIALRIMRKRREFTSPPSPQPEAMLGLVLDGIPGLAEVHSLLFRVVVSEICDCIRDDASQRKSLSEALYLGAVDLFSPMRRGIALNALYRVLTPSLLSCTSLAFSRSDLRKKLLEQNALLSEHDGLRILERLHFDNVSDAKASLLAGSDFSEVVSVFDAAMKFFSGTSVDLAVDLGLKMFELAAELRREGKGEQARSALEMAERSLRLYGSHDLMHYAKVLEQKLQWYGHELDERRAGEVSRKVAQIVRARREHPVVGSLQFSSIGLRRTQRQDLRDLGDRLAFEALAIAEVELPQTSALRVNVRRHFAEAIWRRIVRANRGRATRAGADAEAPPHQALSEFSLPKDGNLLDDLLRLLAHAPKSVAPGSLVLGRFVRVTATGPDSGAIFRVGNDEFLVRKGLIGRKFYGWLRTQVPQWAEDEEEFNEVESAFTGPDRLYLLNLLNPSGGTRHATMVGPLFVKKCLRLFLPGIEHALARTDAGEWVVNGGSNSWSVVRIEPKSMTLALAGGGHLVEMLRQLMDLNRLTLVPISHPDDPFSRITEMRHFVNNTWADLRVREIDTSRLIVQLPEDSEVSPRKVQTWSSMVTKVYPGLSLELLAGLVEAGPGAHQGHSSRDGSFNLDRY